LGVHLPLQIALIQNRFQKRLEKLEEILFWMKIAGLSKILQEKDKLRQKLAGLRSRKKNFIKSDCFQTLYM